MGGGGGSSPEYKQVTPSVWHRMQCAGYPPPCSWVGKPSEDLVLHLPSRDRNNAVIPRGGEPLIHSLTMGCTVGQFSAHAMLFGA